MALNYVFRFFVSASSSAAVLRPVLTALLVAAALLYTALVAQPAYGQQADVAKLVHPEVAERLSLDDAQRASLQQLLQARAEAIAKAPDAAAKAKAASDSETQILAVLTDE